jgi:hypothetical protein
MYVSTLLSDAVSDETFVWLGQRLLTPLAPGETRAFTQTIATLRIEVAAGTYEVVASADDSDVEPELEETNSDAALPIEVLPLGGRRWILASSWLATLARGRSGDAGFCC